MSFDQIRQRLAEWATARARGAVALTRIIDDLSNDIIEMFEHRDTLIGRLQRRLDDLEAWKTEHEAADVERHREVNGNGEAHDDD